VSTRASRWRCRRPAGRAGCRSRRHTCAQATNWSRPLCLVFPRLLSWVDCRSLRTAGELSEGCREISEVGSSQLITKGVEKLRRNRGGSQEGCGPIFLRAAGTQDLAGGDRGPTKNFWRAAVVQQFGPLILTGRASGAEPLRCGDAAVGQGISHCRLSTSEMRVAHARCYTLLTSSHTFFCSRQRSLDSSITAQLSQGLNRKTETLQPTRSWQAV
jgi:hypothetical protein